MKKFLCALILGLVTITASAKGSIDAGKTKSALCAGCHGPEGRNPSPIYPNLAGQHEQYIIKQLKAFKAGTRTNPIMQPMASGLSVQDMENVAAYFSSQDRIAKAPVKSVSNNVTAATNKPAAPVFVPDPVAGKALFELGDETRGLGACVGCHGNEGNSQVLIYPNLAKQHPEYIEKQLRDFKAGTRKSFVMNKFASALTYNEIKNIGAYLANPKAVATAKIRKPTPSLASSPDAVAGKAKASACAACHGSDGNSLIAMYPKLAGQSELYIIKQLKEFKVGLRKNPIMAGMAAPLSAQDRVELASYFSSQKTSKGDGKTNDLGKKLYFGGDVYHDIPACVACHGVTGKGMPQAGFPVLANQNAEYLKTQLMNFRTGARTNDQNSMMRIIARKLKNKQIDELTQYISSL